MSKMREENIMNAPAGNRTDYLGAWKGISGDLEEEIKKIVESDVEDVDAGNREGPDALE